ncbi:MAG TPA: GGDEF domain-containing protein [Solirubrobacteraceae bacterium]|jgi:diguanylate cyclase (GGDEF)-like protein|nr:GGDEF domain-containing protein [Solirubrobacteraceae bacterium]
MHHGEQRAIVDQWALRMRVATFAAGVYLTYVVCGSSAAYVILTWERPNRPLIATMFGIGLIGAAVIAQLPREKIVRSRYREAFFFGWSVVDLLLILVASYADGGTASPLTLIFFVPVVFAAMSYPLGSVAAVGGLSLLSYLGLAIVKGTGDGWSHEALFAVMLFVTGVMSAWQARNHERQRAALMDVSRADPLTGCLNRRGFEERAFAELASATRRDHEASVLLLDVDHFKEVNDTRGHAAGDELLRWVVATLESSVRRNDAIGRIGGDEFAVLLADIDGTKSRESAARIREALAERAPCSIGLATFPLDGTSLEELMRKADSRLYASRDGRAGHGRVSIEERVAVACAELERSGSLSFDAGSVAALIEQLRLGEDDADAFDAPQLGTPRAARQFDVTASRRSGSGVAQPA